MIERRHVLRQIGAIVSAAAASRSLAATVLPADLQPKLFAQCEQASGGRLGVAFLDTARSQRFAWRGGERFPLCSTFKFLLVAAILQRVDRRREALQRSVRITQADLLDYAPFARGRVGGTATVEELCRASMTLSDNTTANVLLRAIGGPAGLTRFCRSLGDPLSRLDRAEPMLGECAPGDPRDTTSPAAMLHDMERILFSPTLLPHSRDRLIGWMIDNRTGAGKIRGGVPEGWRVGDRTGAGEHGTANDIAILWSASGRPILLASYLTGTRIDARARDAVHAEVARIMVAALNG